MPLYELLCLARPLLLRDELQSMIQKVGGMVYNKGGVVTNVVSYGKQPLAYKISGVQGKFDEVSSDQLLLLLLCCFSIGWQPCIVISLRTNTSLWSAVSAAVRVGTNTPWLLLLLLLLQAHIWQLDFALSPEALREVNTHMRINEDVLRHVVVKRSLPTLQSPHTLYHRLSEHAQLLRPPTHPASASTP